MTIGGDVGLRGYRVLSGNCAKDGAFELFDSLPSGGGGVESLVGFDT